MRNKMAHASVAQTRIPDLRPIIHIHLCGEAAATHLEGRPPAARRPAAGITLSAPGVFPKSSSLRATSVQRSLASQHSALRVKHCLSHTPLTLAGLMQPWSESVTKLTFNTTITLTSFCSHEGQAELVVVVVGGWAGGGLDGSLASPLSRKQWKSGPAPPPGLLVRVRALMTPSFKAQLVCAEDRQQAAALRSMLENLEDG
ncbi:hypothetical protein O3P69_007479 [Scylla paramamosain]|uniref:Uncharacterized protein n=1 Tax=Scylla paramamosain TaxID=85552 RepID=A0AAW0V6E2_SCYPA